MYSENTCIYCQESLNQDEKIEVMSSSMLPCQTSQTSSVNLDSQHNNDSQKLKSSHKSKCTQTNIKGEELDLKEVKLSELRNKESKLRKMEEELKLTDKSFEDKNKAKLKLELYVKKLESRVQELELTIKTLKQQSDTPKVGASQDQHQQLPNNPINEQFNEQVMNIHKRVTSIVIKQIDIQLNKLEESLVNTDDKKSESITSSHNNMEHERVGYNTNVSNRNYNMNTNRTNVNSLHKNFEIGRDNTQNREDEDCYIVTPENITSTLKGKPVNSKHTSNFQQRRVANDRPKNSVFNKDKRRQSSTFMNIPNKCMTKSLAREKYKQSVTCNVEQKSNTNQNTNYEHIQNETIHEYQSEIESHHFFRHGRDNTRSKIALDKPKEEKHLSIISFNCKNVKTSVQTINTLIKSNDIILLQEHWLFECQINNLGEINDSIHFAGKGVDKHNPIEPTQMPRGYGGVAILWTDNIDHLVWPLTDGSERIQCIELSLPERKLIVVSVYLPTTGGRDSLMEFQECVDQISEITETYCHTHDILLGGDLNEDLDKNDPTKRTKYLQNLITDYNLHYTSTGKTFTNSSGVDCSEIDYFLYRTTKYEVVQEKTILYLNDSVSDHYPIQIKLNCVLHGDRVEKVKIKPNASKINWRKVDKDEYQNLVESDIYINFLPTKIMNQVMLTKILQI